MQGTARRGLRVAAVLIAVALLVAECDTSEVSPSLQPDGSGETHAPAASQAAAPSASEAPADRSGGTITILMPNEQWNEADPQRVYGGQGLAFLGATLFRSLVTYKLSDDPAVANTLQPDMATDTGRANGDATEWSFTLRDGLNFQDGSPVTCGDVAYGVSRTFATDVISEGPIYAITYLDIPSNDDGRSQYPGPYTATPDQQALFDKAVSCDGNTITFHLNQSVGDFNFTTTLGFNPVPKAADTGETYSNHPVSSGPYQIESFNPGKGGKMILVRNPNWDPATDSIRKAYPDRWEIDFGIDPMAIDQRLIDSQGDDAFAIKFGDVEPQNLPIIFADPWTTNAAFAGRAVSALSPYADFYFVDVQKVPNVKIRQAMAVALDRAAIRLTAGGEFAGALGDGLISPSLGEQYAPTGMWSGLLGQPIPDNGDPEYANQLIQASGQTAPHLTWDYPSTPTRDKEAAIVKASLEKAGFQIDLNPVVQSGYVNALGVGANHEFGFGGWGPDWPNASTIIPPLTTPLGGWDVSHVCNPTCSAADDPEWLTKVDAAFSELDYRTQAGLWQDLNKEAMERVFFIPTSFSRSQSLAGSKVKPVYQWAPYDSWPYSEMYVVKE
jgi:peptide/nickel transport system substrate-binding protein